MQSFPMFSTDESNLERSIPTVAVHSGSQRERFRESSLIGAQHPQLGAGELQ